MWQYKTWSRRYFIGSQTSALFEDCCSKVRMEMVWTSIYFIFSMCLASRRRKIKVLQPAQLINGGAGRPVCINLTFVHRRPVLNPGLVTEVIVISKERKGNNSATQTAVYWNCDSLHTSTKFLCNKFCFTISLIAVFCEHALLEHWTCYYFLF